MTTLLTPPAGDPRSAQEYTFDMIASGQFYTVAAPIEAQEATDSPLLADLEGRIDQPTHDDLRSRFAYVCGQLSFQMESMDDEEVRAIVRVVGALVDQDAPAPAVRVELWPSDYGSTFVNYVAGEGLTRALVGGYDGDKAGVHLVIGWSAINDRMQDVLTLADVRQIRDNLTALLNDERIAWHRIQAEKERARE